MTREYQPPDASRGLDMPPTLVRVAHRQLDGDPTEVWGVEQGWGSTEGAMDGLDQCFYVRREELGDSGVLARDCEARRGGLHQECLATNSEGTDAVHCPAGEDRDRNGSKCKSTQGGLFVFCALYSSPPALISMPIPDASMPFNVLTLVTVPP